METSSRDEEREKDKKEERVKMRGEKGKCPYKTWNEHRLENCLLQSAGSEQRVSLVTGVNITQAE